MKRNHLKHVREFFHCLCEECQRRAPGRRAEAAAFKRATAKHINRYIDADEEIVDEDKIVSLSVQ